MPSFTDHLGRTISIDNTPKRIISLVPSQTELLYALGLEAEVVGITKFCVHPPSWFRSKTRIGGTKNINPGIIDSLRPDLIIANKEENRQDQVEALATRYPVWISDIDTLPAALDMIRTIGRLTGKSPRADQLAEKIDRRFTALAGASPHPVADRPRTAYFIWRKPWMVAGGDTFIHDMLQRCGFDNIFHDQPRYPSITLDALPAADCNLILLSSEPYPFKQHHIDEIRTTLPHAAIRLVDGELFSWYGSRLLEAPAYFQALYEGLDRKSDL